VGKKAAIKISNHGVPNCLGKAVPLKLADLFYFFDISTVLETTIVNYWSDEMVYPDLETLQAF